MKLPSLPHFALFFFAFLLGPLVSHAQTPTNQDCLDAIPICQNVYSTTISYSGEGNFPNEISNSSSCLGSGELNDVWYTFTVQSSGNLNFLITPNNSADDYDWAVYNLTNNNCSDIFTNPGLEVSCNFSATPGTTGPNGGSSLNSQPASGNPYNQVVPVTAGQTYVVNVSNFSSTQNGYTINFGASTAVIFDQVPPTLVSVSNPGCGGNTLTFTFSENILCNTVQASDFTITGPGGPYTVTNVTSVACSQGAQYDNTFTVTISPGVGGAGTYNANLVGPVTDLCGNVAIFPASIPFTVGSFSYTNSSTAATCAASNGTATVNITGAGPFSYSWTPNVSTTNAATGLSSGVYTVVITDQVTGCVATDTIHVNQNNTLNVTTSGNDSICPGQTATLTATPIGANPPVTYTWSNSLPNQASVNVTPAATTTYTLNITDAMGCSAGPLLFTITVAGPVSVNASGASPICAGGGSTLTASASGGDGNFTYNWMPGNLSGGTVTVTPASTTTYTVTATDGCGQTATQTVSVVVQQLPVINFTADTLRGCAPLPVHFTLDTTSFPAGTTYLWAFNDNGATSTASSPGHTFTTPGCHDITVTVTVPPGCSSSQTVTCMIVTIQQPTASFVATPPVTDILNPTIDFTNNSTNANTWYWSYGDSTNTTVFEETHTYGEPGIYNVYLVALNDSGCVDTAFGEVVVNDYHTFFVPNAFTPDDNGHNETFGPVYTNILSEGFSMLIFDRWGNVVYETHDPSAGWNGRFKNTGKMVQQDVYVYRIDYTDNMNMKYKLFGHVTLLR